MTIVQRNGEIITEELAEQYYEREEYRQALEYYKILSQLNNQKASFYVGQGKCYCKIRAWTDALNAFKDALQVQIGNTPVLIRIYARIGILYCYIGLDDDENALRAFSTLIRSLASDNMKSVREAISSIDKFQRNLEIVLKISEQAIYKPVKTDTLSDFYYTKSLVLREIQLQERAIDTYKATNTSQSPIIDTPQTIQRDKSKFYWNEGRSEKIIDTSSKMVQECVKKGHALFARNLYQEAAKIYELAIDLGVQDADVYRNFADCLRSLARFDEAVVNYKKSLALSPRQPSVCTKIGNIEYLRKNYKEAFDAYEQTVSLGEKRPEIYLRMGDCLNAYDVSSDDYYKKALYLTEQIKSVQRLRALINDADVSSRPANIRLELLCALILLTPSIELTREEIINVALLYEQCCSSPLVPIAVHQSYLQKLLLLVKHIPAVCRSEVLLKATKKNWQKLAEILILLAPDAVAGLHACTRELVREWMLTSEFSELALRLYSTFNTYAVPQEEREVFYIQLLFAQSQYVEAEALIADFMKRPVIVSRVLWLFADIIERYGRPFWLQIKILQRLNELTPTDTKLVDAWIHVGDYCSQHEDRWQDAVAAYENAEKLGTIAPTLRAFRQGMWNDIPALRTSPDYHFPVIVALDLECAYRPDALPGSTIFEVGAVRRKGTTELDSYHSYVYHESSFGKATDRRPDAKDVTIVMQELHEFIGADIVVGHNIRAFDSVQLRGVGLDLPGEQILDTLEVARLLYPDSLHHNLGFLCEQLRCPFEGKLHDALPDAQACANLLYKLGDELLQRGDALIAGFRAFVSPDSAFDRAILRPRKIAADPSVAWKLDPAPSPIHQLVAVHAPEVSASPTILHAIQTQQDALIERYDPRAAYIEHIPHECRTLVTASNRQRLERMLLATKARDDVYVLPNPQTLLCPQHVKYRIEQQQEYRMKLLLFCLYQASHNHDIRTLYPFRLSSDEMHELREMLLEDCCGRDSSHALSCVAHREMREAMETAQLLLATHENFIQHQKLQRIKRGLLIVDNLDELQMHFVDYAGEYIDSDEHLLPELTIGEREALQQLTMEIATFTKVSIDVPGYHERIQLSVLNQWIKENRDIQPTLERLEGAGSIGSKMVQQIRTFADESESIVQPERSKASGLHVRAYWLDLWFEASEQEHPLLQTPVMKLERWRFCKLDCDIPRTFEQYFLQGFEQRILCGDAISLGSFKTTFVRRFFGLSEQQFPFFEDHAPAKQLLIPKENAIRSSSFLNRREWARDVGNFLHRWMLVEQQPLVVTLYETQVTQAFAEAWHTLSKERHDKFSYQVLSPHLKWSSTKIVERLSMPNRRTLTLLSPASRRNTLDTPVDIEGIGPLRFLNRRDPVVAAMIRAFALDASHSSEENQSAQSQLHTYLLPQAMLELKTRLASPAKTHILLDSAIYSRVYRDEVLSLLQKGHITEQELPAIHASGNEQTTRFDEVLLESLKRHGYGQQKEVLDKELQPVLKAIWRSEAFKRYQREDGTYIEQKAIIHDVFEGKDQLVVVATGGGKSLCFQLPAILKAEDVVPEVTLVVSPLIALMQDQVQSLNRKGIFSAIMLNSQLSQSERKAHLEGICSGDYSIIYMTPEQVYSSTLRKALEKRTIGLIAIDEAHCVSSWGHDFRPEYSVLRHWIASTLYKARQRTVPVIALTATARSTSTNDLSKSTIQDIIDKLGLQIEEAQALIASPDRPELRLSVVPAVLHCPFCKQVMQLEATSHLMYCPECRNIVEDYECKLWNEKCNELIRLLEDRGENGLRSRWDKAGIIYQRGIIYCRTRANTEKLVAEIIQRIPELRNKIAAYHAGLEQDERKHISSNFVTDDEQSIRLVVATNAFGMGIDAARLGYVIHFDVPATPENYYQEVGRAGRNFKDAETAQCILLYNDADIEDQRRLVSGELITRQDIERVYEVLCTLRKQRGQDTFLVTESELALHTGVDREQIKTLLYYLEYHTTAKEKPVIKGGEYATHSWYVRFIPDCQEREKKDRFLTQEARNLLGLLQSSFHLTTNEETPLDVEKLEQHVEQKKVDGMVYAVRSVEEELRLLIRRGFLIRTNSRAGSIALREELNVATLRDTLKHIEQDVNTFLDTLTTKRGYQLGYSLDLAAIIKKLAIESVAVHDFIYFLFLLSQGMNVESVGKLRVFETFKRDIHRSSKKHRELYKVRLEQSCTSGTNRKNIVKTLFSQLDEAVGLLARLNLDDGEIHNFDPFKVASTHKGGLWLHECLLWLEKLGLLTYKDNLLFDGTRYITLLHPIEPRNHIAKVEDLVIDLDALYQQEVYKQKKLQLMKDYAHITDNTERLRFLNEYFLGKRSLMTSYHLLDELTAEQKAAITSTALRQLVVGEAGSGKTRVLIERIKYLMKEKLVPAGHSIVFTHLNNGINRIRHNIKKHQQECEGEQQFPEMLTLHSFASRIFTKNHDKLMRPDGKPYYNQEKQLYLSQGSYEERKKAELAILHYVFDLMWDEAWENEQDVRRTGLDCLQWQRKKRKAVNSESVVDSCLKAIDIFRQQGVFPGCSPRKEDIERTLRGQCLNDWGPDFYYSVYVTYLQAIGDDGYYTYDDQILYAYALLMQHQDLQHHYSYDYVFIDEIQDLTTVQVKLLQLLVREHTNVFAAGDDGQRILINKGQEHSCKNKFFQLIPIPYEDYEIYELIHNFRMSQEIHNLALAVRNPKHKFPVKYEQYVENKLPVILSVETQFIPKSDRKISDQALHAMLDAAIEYSCNDHPNIISNIAFVVAFSGWRVRCEKYLQERKYQFVILESTRYYQTGKMRKLLLHLRLITAKNCDDDLEELIDCCLPYYMARDVIARVRLTSSLRKCSVLSSLELCLDEGGIEQKYVVCLRQHLDIIKQFSRSCYVGNVAKELENVQEKDYEDEEEDAEDEKQDESYEQKVRQWKDYTVEQALKEVQRHIAIVEDVNEYDEEHNPFILTTCDYAKSQDFDTVFIIGADHIRQQERLYVNISRAKQRLILVTNENSLGLLKRVPEMLYKTMRWPCRK